MPVKRNWRYWIVTGVYVVLVAFALVYFLSDQTFLDAAIYTHPIAAFCLAVIVGVIFGLAAGILGDWYIPSVQTARQSFARNGWGNVILGCFYTFLLVGFCWFFFIDLVRLKNTHEVIISLFLDLIMITALNTLTVQSLGKGIVLLISRSHHQTA